MFNQNHNQSTQFKRFILMIVFVGTLVFLAIFMLISLVSYYVDIPYNPADHGYMPTETVPEVTGKFVMNRYRLKAHWLDRYLSGNPHQKTDNGYDTVIVITDLSGKIIARISHWDGDPEIVVTPAGIKGTGGIEWKVPP